MPQNQPKRKCTFCGKTLVPIGTSRVNGKTHHGDWGARDLHKKCFVEFQRQEEQNHRLKQNEKTINVISDIVE